MMSEGPEKVATPSANRLSARAGRILAVLVVAAAFAEAALSSPAEAPASRPARLKLYKSQYYDIYTDLEGEVLAEVKARLTAMGGEYHRRTKGFTTKKPKPMPFYIFSEKSDYYAAGGIPGSAGTYRRDKLLAHFRQEAPSGSWRTIQHEGFHQFADQTIGRRLPVWLSEGLAEYFEEGIWTGDHFVTGLVPPRRLKRLKEAMAADSLVGFDEMIGLSRKAWNDDIRVSNYDQAWSMVHFLVHGYEGQYQKRFSAFVNDVAAGRPWKMAFKNRFGGDTDAFQEKYKNWWQSLSENPTSERYLLATVQTLTSFLARAYSQGRRFRSMQDFLEAAREGQLQTSPAQWLPESLLAAALSRVEQAGQWSLGSDGQWPSLVLKTSVPQTFVGTFHIKGSKVTSVEVTIAREGPQPERRR